MDAVGEVTHPLELLIAECAKTWPQALASTLATPDTSEARALRSLVECAREGKTATLPYVHAGKGLVFWLSFGADLKSMLEYGEDLRSWVMPAYGTNGDLTLVQTGSGGQLAQLVDEVSRWLLALDVRSPAPTSVACCPSPHAYIP
jgi:hypothetical protein